jgi:general secretion pathway protein A
MILVGQPELIDGLSRPELRQLKQRVAINCFLDYLSEEEIEGYIQRRLFVAGDKGNIRFTKQAKKQIAKASRGIPRLINKICDYALTAGYITDDFTIKPKHVTMALDELGNLHPTRLSSFTRGLQKLAHGNHRWLLYGIIPILALLVILGYWFLQIS